MRVYGWLAIGLGLRTWAAVHRWHHATGDEDHAPFSPARAGSGLHTIARETIAAHWAAVRDPGRVARYTDGLPDDALERFIQADERRFFGVFGLRLPLWGALLCAPWLALGLPLPWALAAAAAVFVPASGSVLWMSVWVVNGLGHRYGRRNFDTRDRSTNVVRADWLAMGEALHNNHHALPGSANMAVAAGEVDPSWWILRGLARVGLVQRLVA